MVEAKAAYDEQLAHALAAQESGDFTLAIECSVRAWRHVEGMMRHDMKYENETFGSLPCVDLVLELAPLLLHHAALRSLDRLLTDRQWIERKTTERLALRLHTAREKMRQLQRIWSHVEGNPGITDSELIDTLQVPADLVHSALAGWQKAGLLDRIVDGHARLYLVTDLAARWRAKCAACGRLLAAPKRAFLVEAECPGCHHSSSFVLVQPDRVEGSS